jgi:hypothetical protein
MRIIHTAVKGLIVLFISLTAFVGCGNKKTHNRVVDPEMIYFDYRITGQEGYDKLTVFIQFRYEDPNGETILLEDPSKVELDGEVFPVDSSVRTGFYYELYKPIDSFAGKHKIRFTGFDKEQKEEEFEFEPLRLLSVIPDTLHRSDLVLELEGAGAEDSVRVLLTDTAFYSNGINRVDSVKNGRLVLTKYDLQSLANGPVQLELILEKENPLKSAFEGMGRLLVTYSVRREFILKD